MRLFQEQGTSMGIHGLIKSMLRARVSGSSWTANLLALRRFSQVIRVHGRAMCNGFVTP